MLKTTLIKCCFFAVVSPLHETVTRVQKGCTGLQWWSQLRNSGLYHSWWSVSGGEWKKPTIYFLLFRTCTYYKLLLMIQITKSNYLIVLLSLFYILQIFQYNIRSYPTTIFYNQSVPHQYHGHHDSYHILEFIQVNIYCTSWFLCRCKFLHFNLK